MRVRRCVHFFFQAEDGIRDFGLSRGLGDVYKGQGLPRAIAMITSEIGVKGTDGPADLWLRDAATWTWRTKLGLAMFMDLLGELRKRAHQEATDVFARNLKDLLLAAPAGNKRRPLYKSDADDHLHS